MDIQRTQSVSPILSAERTANQQQVATVKLSNDIAKQQGQASLKLIDSAVDAAPKTQAFGRVGNFLNVKA